MRVPIRRGCVLWLPDGVIRMPPEKNREVHDRRAVLVLSGDRTNTDDGWPIFMGCPISSKNYATEFDVKFSANSGGLSKKGWIRVPLLQPFPKTDVLDRAGQFNAATIDEVVARWLQYAGAIGG